MNKTKITDDVLRRIDSMNEADAFTSYTPSKVKKIVSEELFDESNYKEEALAFSKTAEDIKREKRNKVVKTTVITVITVGVLVTTGVVVKNIIENIIEGRKQSMILSKFISNGALIDKSKLPINGILSNSNKIDTDGDGLTNDIEIKIGSLTNSKDSDNDGISDRIEYDTKGLNIVSKGGEQKLSDIKAMGYSINDIVSIEELSKENMAKALNIENTAIIGAYKVYNAIGKTQIKGVSKAETLLVYKPEFNSFVVQKFEQETGNVSIDLEGDYVAVFFNLTEKEVFKKISYKQVKGNNLPSEYVNKVTGLPLYKKLYLNNEFKTKFNIKINGLPFPTVWDSKNGPNTIGQAAFIGAAFNGVVFNNYDEMADKYSTYNWIVPSNYHYDLKEYIGKTFNEIEFKSMQLQIPLEQRNKPTESDKLPRPDKEFVGAITQLNNIILDAALKDIALQDNSYSENTLRGILEELQMGNTVLCIMSNEKSIHSVLIYGVAQSEIDNDVYSFSVYDSNINTSTNDELNVMKAELKKYPDSIKTGGRYGVYDYGYGQNYSWSGKKGDVFLFYKIRTDLKLERIQ